MHRVGREVRKRVVEDVVSEMMDGKNQLLHVRELLGVLVRRARCAEAKTEIAARRLDRMSEKRTKSTMPSMKPIFRKLSRTRPKS